MKHHDPVNHPTHYTKGGYEVIDVIEAYNLNFRLSNVIKYVLRHEHKGKPIEDLEKALFYLQRDIEQKKAALAEEANKQKEEPRPLTQDSDDGTLWVVEMFLVEEQKK